MYVLSSLQTYSILAGPPTPWPEVPFRRPARCTARLTHRYSSNQIRTCKMVQATSSFDAALGAFVGACIGDAAGAVLEFPRVKHISPERVAEAMKMPGGGVFKLGPGQITDDSELALCLAQGLMTSKPPNYPQEAVAQKYADWKETGPFDIGFTCDRAFSAGLAAVEKGQPVAQAMQQASREGSMESQSNGALMRSTPLAIWGHQLSHSELARCAIEDATLSHPNPICQGCNAIYCIAIAHLIRNPGDATGAITAALEFANADPEIPSDVSEWLKDAVHKEHTPSVGKKGGWVRWGFHYAFRHLKLGSSYEDALRDVLSRGGDVDTNAAIMGGLVGAHQGASNIPAYLKDPVLARDGSSPGKAVEPFLYSSQVPALARQLFDLAA